MVKGLLLDAGPDPARMRSHNHGWNVLFKIHPEQEGIRLDVAVIVIARALLIVIVLAVVAVLIKNRLFAKGKGDTQTEAKAAPRSIDPNSARHGGASSAVPSLIVALRAKDKDERRRAAAALGKIGTAEVIGSLGAVLLDSEEKREVEEAAAAALSIVGPPAIETLVFASGCRGNFTLLRDTLEQIDPNWAKSDGARAAVPSLISVLDGSDKRYFGMLGGAGSRANVAAVLGTIGDQQSVEPLVTALLRDEYWDVREEAAKALGAIGDKRAVMPLVQVLNSQHINDGGGGGALRAVVTALGHLDPQALAGQIPLLRDYYPRAMALEELKKIGVAWQEPNVTQQKCPDCDGASIPGARGDGKCSTCHGLGVDSIAPTITDLFEGNFLKCDRCNGSKRCQGCNGSGYVTVA